MSRSYLFGIVAMLGLSASAQDCLSLSHGETTVPCGQSFPISVEMPDNPHSMRLNGSTSYLHCTDNEAFNMVGKDFSLSAWIKPNTDVGRQNIIMSASSTWASHGAYTLYIEDGILRFTIRHMQASPWYRHLITVPVDVDEWSHVVAVGDREDQAMRLYLNGNLVGSLDWDGNMFRDASMPLMVGVQYKEDWPGQYFAYFDGDIDDVGIWERVLEESEIQGMVDCPFSSPPMDDVVAFWPMNEGNGQSTLDISSDERDLIRLFSANWSDSSPYGQGPYDILWSTGQTTTSISPEVSSDTLFTVEVSDAEGNIYSAEVSAIGYNSEFELEEVKVCWGDSYTFPDGVTVNHIISALSYMYESPSADCLSHVIYMVSPEEIPTSISVGTESLRADGWARRYQWYRCTDWGKMPVLGATSRTLHPTHLGEYSVTLFGAHCQHESECVEWRPEKKSNAVVPVEQQMLVWPNPSQGQLQWQTQVDMELENLLLFDMQGRLVMKLVEPAQVGQMLIEEPGVYLFQWRTAKGATGQSKVVVR